RLASLDARPLGRLASLDARPLGWRAWLAWLAALGSPARARLRDARRDPVGEGIAAVGLAGLHALTGERAHDDLMHAPRDIEEAIEVDARLDAHRVQTVHEVLAAHVAGRARRERTAAQATDRRVEVRDPQLHRREDVRDRHRPRVVRVERPFDAGEARHQVLERARDLTRVRHPGRVRDADRPGAHVDELAHDPLDPGEGHVAFEGTAERRGDAGLHGDARAAGDLHDPAQLRERFGDRHVDVGEVVALA